MLNLQCPRVSNQQICPLENHYCIKNESSLGMKFVCNYRVSSRYVNLYSGINTTINIKMTVHQFARVCNNPHLCARTRLQTVSKRTPASMSIYVDLPDVKIDDLTTRMRVQFTDPDIEKGYRACYIDMLNFFTFDGVSSRC